MSLILVLIHFIYRSGIGNMLFYVKFLKMDKPDMLFVVIIKIKQSYETDYLIFWHFIYGLEFICAISNSNYTSNTDSFRVAG